MRRTYAHGVGITLALLLPIAGCSSQEPAPAPAEAAASAAGYFSVPAAQLSHLQIVPAAKSVWNATLRTTGTVDWDSDHTTQVISQVNGPVTRLAVDVGVRVKAGDPLMYVSSPDIANAISAYRKAKNRLDLAQKTLDRSKDLLSHKAIAERDFEGAQADFNDASTDMQTALQALRIFGVTADDLTEAEHQNVAVRAELPMRAPIGGVVVQRLVLPGQFVQAGTSVAFVISDDATVWVQGHIYEKDLTSIHVGDEVDESNTALPVTFHGKVATIDHLVDPATRTTLVRIVTANTGGLLRKDMFVDLVIHDSAHHDVIAVPSAAILRDDQNLPFVYVQVEAGKFAQRAVTVGGQQGDLIEVTAGLKPGDQVVSQGSVFLQFANSTGK